MGVRHLFFSWAKSQQQKSTWSIYFLGIYLLYWYLHIIIVMVIFWRTHTLLSVSHTFLISGERPYRCHLTECGRAFIQLSNLQQHLRNHDAQLERAKSRPFHCNICGKGFATESSLRTHTSKVSLLRVILNMSVKFNKKQ